MENDIQIQAQAAAFRQMVKHFQTHTEVQNIDMMILAGFCRNCLTKWYTAGLKEQGEEPNIELAQEFVYGMSYKEWKQHYQTKASSEKLLDYEQAQQKRQKAQDALTGKS